MTRPRVVGRRKPYTALGVRRARCQSCGGKGHAQWSICALGNRFVVLCKECDLTVNAWALTFMRVPGRARIMARYTKRVLG